MLPLNTAHTEPCLPNQACLSGTSEPDSCGKRPAEYSPPQREVACKRGRGSMHGDSLGKQNMHGTYGTQPAVADLQASTPACNRVDVLCFMLGLYPHQAIVVRWSSCSTRKPCDCVHQAGASMFGVCRKVQSLNVEACVASYHLMLLAFCQREATRHAIYA